MVVDTVHHRVITVPPDQAPVDDGQDVLATAIRDERRQISMIHGEDMVEAREVFGLERSRPMNEDRAT